MPTELSQKIRNRRVSLPKQKIAVGMLSLGCPKTLVDSELVLGQLDSKRYRIADHITDCDIAVINTCSFIEEAKQESIDRILELIELKKEKRIRSLIVLGCLYQRYPKEIEKELKEVDAFIGTGEYDKFLNVLDRVSAVLPRRNGHVHQSFSTLGKAGYIYNAADPRVALTPAHYRYVKISEGCDHICQFCAIPAFRGKHRSRPIDDIAREISQLADEGAKEIILTGQDTSYYGRDFSGQFLLPRLLEKLNDVTGIQWLRLLYAYPSCITNELIDTIAKLPKVCHYLDMPLQHISDPILLSMKRGITKERTLRIIAQFRRAIPDLAIRTTFIVGYPGETEAQFEELLGFMRDIKFERLGIFTYSDEDGTPAAALPDKIPESVKDDRFRRAMELQQVISRGNNDRLIGRDLDVLIDEPDPDQAGLYRGRSYMDAPEVDGLIYIQAEKGTRFRPGQFIRVRITGAREYDLRAKPL